MTALAALATGLFVALLVAAATGHLPTLASPPRRRPSSALEVLLARAGVDRSPAAVRLAQGIGGVTALATAWGVSDIPALGLVPGALATAAPRVWLGRRALRRVAEIRRAWPDALAQVGGSVRAGRPLSHALVDVSLTGPEALRTLLSGLAARTQTVGLVAALQAVADVAGDPVTDRVVEVLALAHAEGGRVVIDVVEDLAAGIAEEVHAAEELDALSLEGRLNAKLVFALPWLVLVLLTTQGGPFRAFYTATAGTAVIVVAAVLSLLGITIVGRLSTIPPEPRVLRAEEAAA